jgi:hypothetical protein
MTMGYDLLVAGDFSFARLRAALARINEVPVDAVDVAAADVEDRDWQAAVLCTGEPRTGDISWSLDIYVTDAAGVERSVAESAEELAFELRVPVLYDAGGVRPSAYWLVAPDGPRTRARVYDGPGDGSLVIDEDLGVRDELSRAKVPAEVAEPFRRALETVDDAFRAHTRRAASEPGRGWWWARIPDPEPWAADAH